MNEVNHDEVRGVGCESDEHRARRWGGTELIAIDRKSRTLLQVLQS